jgi:hypothetical protein
LPSIGDLDCHGVAPDEGNVVRLDMNPKLSNFYLA